MGEKIIKYVEYIGDKDKKRYYSNLHSAWVEFAESEDFGGRKVAAVDPAIAEELLRFTNVYREIEVSEIVRETSKGGSQKDLLEEKGDSVVDRGKGKTGKGKK